MEIEKRSFAIIEEELRSMGVELPEDKKHIAVFEDDLARNVVSMTDGGHLFHFLSIHLLHRCQTKGSRHGR